MKDIRTEAMDSDRIDQIIDKHQGEASSLIQILLDIQSENHWLPKEVLERVSEKLRVPLTRIQHIATFYKAFSLVPKVMKFTFVWGLPVMFVARRVSSTRCKA
jgi:NADH:ubiquinone oxidoreductase subunit E